MAALLDSSSEYLLLAETLCPKRRRLTSRVVPCGTPDSGDLPYNRHNFSLGTPIEVNFFFKFLERKIKHTIQRQWHFCDS